MKKVLVVIFILSLLIIANKTSACDISAIQADYSARGLSGSGMEQEAIDNCLRAQRRQDQQIRDQQASDAANSQKIYQIKIDYFYTEDAIEKQFDALNKSDFNYAQYKLSSADCRASIMIPSDPTTLDPNVFLSLMPNKEKCVEHISKYVPAAIKTLQQPTKSNDQICSDKFGSNWKWISGTTCGCKDGYTQKNGDCINYDQSCNIDFPNSKFLNIGDNGRIICDCKIGYIWNTQRTGCVIKPIAPLKTNDQICNDSYGINSNWDGTITDDGKISCNCKAGYKWNQEMTQCTKVDNNMASIVNTVKENPSIPAVDPNIVKDLSSSSNVELIGVLRIPGVLRECPNTSCKIIRYYTETASVAIITTDDSNEWYRVKARNDDGEFLIGWMSQSLFTEDFREKLKKDNSQQQILEASSLDNVVKDKKLKQGVFRDIMKQGLLPWLFKSINQWFKK